VLVVICYDVSTVEREGRRRMRQIAEVCQDHGTRVQFSIFECRVTPTQWVFLRSRLLELYEPEQDSLRFYQLDEASAARTEHHGVREPLNPTDPLIL
jgi:CRISPR-associated protein Cas2